MGELIQDIKPTVVSSAYVDGLAFDKAKEQMEKAGYRLITAEENVGLRVQHGKDAKVSTWGNYVKEGSLMVPQKGRFITRSSLVLAFPKKATQAHREGKEFYITPEQAEILISDSVKVPYDVKSIPTNRFGEEPVTVFLFGKNAERYGLFLRETANIMNMPLSFNEQSYIDSKDKPFVNQAWLASLGYGSIVYGNSRGLSSSSSVRGVRFDAEGVAPQKPLQIVYTLDQISQAFKVAGIPRLESMVTEVLVSAPSQINNSKK